MIVYFIILMVAYALFTGWLYKGWYTLPKVDVLNYQVEKVAIVVTVRNEENNIEKLITSLEAQTYPHHAMEVYVYDDGSEDKTWQKLQKLTSKVTFKLHLQQVNQQYRWGGVKKQSITQVVDKTPAQLVVTTDGDCVPHQGWLAGLVAHYQKLTPVFISGPVQYSDGRTLFEKIQQVEFASLIVSGAALIKNKVPSMCNGANMAFSKEAFLAVEGYKGLEQEPSGDDEFLMHRLFEKYSNKICFAKHKDVLVETGAKKSIHGFHAQRKRWASKWGKYQFKSTQLVALIVFLFAFLYLNSLWILLFFPSIWMVFIGAWLIKLIGDFVLINRVLVLGNTKLSLFLFLLTEVFHIFYVCYYGLLAHSKNYQWKGRHYS